MPDTTPDAVIVQGPTPNDPCIILMLNMKLSLSVAREVVLKNAREQLQFAAELRKAGYQVTTLAEALSDPETRRIITRGVDVWGTNFRIPPKYNTPTRHDA